MTHLHKDIDGSIAMCKMKVSECSMYQSMGNDVDIPHSCTCQGLYNHTTHSLDGAESLYMSKDNLQNFNNTGRKYKNQFNDHQHEIMMKDYYTHNQDKMTADEIRELKIKIFPYLNSDEMCI